MLVVSQFVRQLVVIFLFVSAVMESVRVSESPQDHLVVEDDLNILSFFLLH